VKFDPSKNWTEYPVVAFDTETSGPYPIESEIIELGAVKWFKGEIIAKFQTLLKPSTELQADNIRIHGITNEMVSDAPLMRSQILNFCEFIDDSVLIAHHAPFDVGFLTLDIERAGLRFPNCYHLCTSLISRALLATSNHKLQTMIKELKLVGGDAHRAYDDAFACFQVFQKSCEKLGDSVSLEKLSAVQIKKIGWDNYRVFSSTDQKLKSFSRAAQQKKTIQIVYPGGSTKSKPRSVTVFGIVRNPDGDYIHALCGIDHSRKRFYLNKITDYDVVN
jgi:DNA polymerase III subunit epsilon